VQVLYDYGQGQPVPIAGEVRRTLEELRLSGAGR